jgi:hypothetical protein
VRKRIIAMLVKVLGSYNAVVAVPLHSIGEVSSYLGASKILTLNGKEYSSNHPPDAVNKALRVYAGLLSGREEAHIPFPSFPSSNVVRDPQSISSFDLDLTKEKIEITEESTPVDEEGNIQLDATQTRVRTLSYDKGAAQKQAESEALKAPQIGQTIPGKGVFVGVWKPKDRDGNSLGKAFNVYAAPQDLTDESGQKALLTFKDAAKRLTALGNWHGYNGGDFGNDTALYKALGNGSYHGEWFIPPRELLVGTDLNGNKVQDDNLYANQGKGDLKGTFTTARGSSSDYPDWYWSCTERRDGQSLIWKTRFSDGYDVWNNIDYTRLSCRPCRVEVLAKKPPAPAGPA